ncbi:IclR family transcriptional regulator [Nocardioides sp. LHG3406-4]|uniref:IclR family transcriptional regulator n=1 Tax=Nocardioides sp. LHG3406-4 TaxID=2804575 RepID=UPI003CF06618
MTGDRAGVLPKAMRVLTAYGPDDHVLTFTELRGRTELAKATLHRVAADMVSAGLLERHDEGYRLSGRIFEIGMRAATGRGLLELATPYLEELYGQLRETVHFGIRDGDEVVYLSKTVGHRAVAAPSRLGGRMPLHVTAIGKVLLAHAPAEVRARVLGGPLARHTPRTVVAPGLLERELEQVRATGAAFEFEESAPGLTCVGAPVREGSGSVVAAVSVSGPITRFHAVRQRDLVVSVADGIGRALAGSGWSSAERNR